jgi:flagellar FliL protein
VFWKKKPKAEAADEAATTEAPAEGAEAPAEGEAAEEGKKKPPLKLIIIGAAAALVVLGGGGGAAWFFLAPKGEAGHAEKKGGGHGGGHEKKKDGGGHGKEGEETTLADGAVIRPGPDGVTFYTMPDIVVNMQSADGRPTFLKLKLTLELPDDHVVEVLNPNMPRLHDMFQTFLRELRPEDLNGSQGSYQLRMEILRRVNLIVAPAKVNAVLIEEMLIN